jgi:hypothetical protein
MPRLRQMAEEAGRDPQSLSVTLGGAPEDIDVLKSAAIEPPVRPVTDLQDRESTAVTSQAGQPGAGRCLRVREPPVP